jgi:hypothetical protein
MLRLVFQTYGSLCKRYYSVLSNIASVLSYYCYMCDLNILGRRVDASVLSSRTRVWQVISEPCGPQDASVARPNVLKDIYITKLFFQKYYLFLVPIFWGALKIVILHSSCSNDRWLTLASPPARPPTVSPLVSWHLRMCHNCKSHITTHHCTHLRRRSLLRSS